MRVLSAILLLGVAACSDTTGLSSPEDLLSQNRALWGRKGPASYEYVITRSCECLPESAGPVTVVVRGGQVDTRHYASGAPVDPQYDQLFTSVPGLFELIQHAVDLPAAALAVRYNGELGYPESIQIDWVAGAVDDEVSYRITEFTSPPR